MLLVYAASRLTIGIACLNLLVSQLYSLPVLASSETFKAQERQFINQDRALNVKCGYKKSQIKFKAPLQLQPSKIDFERRVDGVKRCEEYSPPIRLTALMPESNLGLTTAEYPTFFFYVPYTHIEKAEFVLMDEKENHLYVTTIPIKETDGIVSVSLPSSSTLPPLEVGKSYLWSFSLIFDPEDRDADASVAGEIKRVKLDSTVSSKLNNASQGDRAAIYASNGIWHDTLTSLAKLRCSNPQDLKLADEWRSLMEQVGLLKISRQPIAKCNSEYNN